MATKPVTANKSPEILAMIGAELSVHLGKSGLKDDKVSDIALGFMETLRKTLGGQLVYFPKGAKIDMDKLSVEIYDKHFHGAAVHDLVQEYNVSTAYIYRVLASERARRKQERDAEAEARREARRDADKDRWKREGGLGVGTVTLGGV